MKDWLVEKRVSNAARKQAEAEAIAAFLAEGKAKTLSYSDENSMKKIQKGWHRQTSPAVIAQKEEDEKYLLFSKEERLKN